MSFWEWITENPEITVPAGVTLVVAAIGGLWRLYQHITRASEGSEPEQSISGNQNVQIGRAQVNQTISVGAKVDVGALMDKLASSARREGELATQLAHRNSEIEDLRAEIEDLRAQLRDAVTVLAEAGGAPDTPPGIDRALALLKERQTELANAYGNLGNRYAARGELDRAEEMHRRALETDKALERRPAMAADYGNLGNLYAARGELNRAEEMLLKSLGLYREIGAAEQVQKMEGALADVRARSSASGGADE